MHALAILVLLATGCSGGPPPGPVVRGVPPGGGGALIDDPGISWLTRDEPPIAAPTVPWIETPGHPLGTECPDGWRHETTARGAPYCEPWPESGRATCGSETSAHFPGEAACVEILTTTPIEWPLSLPPTGVIYVRAGAALGAGTRELPFGTLAEALAVATPGATIALAAGQYRGPATLPPMISIVGVGAATQITGATAGMPVLTITGVAQLTDLVIDGALGPGLDIRDGAQLTGRAIVVRRAIGEAISVGAAMVTLTDLIVRSSVAPPDPRVHAGGVVARGAAVVDLRHAAIERHEEHAIAAHDGALIRVSDARIADTVLRAPTATDPEHGENVYAYAGSQIWLDRVAVEGGSLAGMVAVGEDARLDATDVVVRGVAVAELAGVPSGVAIACADMAACVTEGLVIAGSEQAGAIVTPGATLTLRRAVLHDTAGPAVDADRGEVTVEGAVIEGIAGSAVRGTMTAWAITDVLFRDLAAAELEDGTVEGGWAIEVSGGEIRATHLVIERAEGGALIADRASPAVIGDFVIRDLAIPARAGEPAAPGPAGRAISSAARFERGTVDRAAGFVAELVADVDVTDVRTVACEGPLLALDTRAILRGARLATSCALARAIGGGRLTLDDAVLAGDLAAPADAIVLDGAGVSAITRVLLRDVGGSISALATPVDGAPAPTGALAIADTVIDGADRGIELAVPSVTITRVRVEGARAAGVRVSGGDLEAGDLAIGGSDGRGLQVDGGGRALLDGARIVGVRDVAVLVAGASSSATLEDVRIETVRVCDVCAGGDGIVAIDEGAVTAHSFTVTGAERAGVVVARGGDADLSEGEITSCGTALVVPIPGYDLTRLQLVRIAGNGSDLDTTEPALPSVDPL